jgi:chaperonin GroES
MDDLVTQSDTTDNPDPYGDGETQDEAPKRDVRNFEGVENIAPDLAEEELSSIGSRCYREYEIDNASRSEWLAQIERATKLAMQVKEEKSFPWPKAANIKYPLLTEAALQFNARAYPAIIQGKDVVKPKVTGSDDGQPQMGPDGQPVMGPDGSPAFSVPPGAKRARGMRVAEHMSWQLTEQMSEWEEDTDRLLIMLPIVGCMFRKEWYDPIERRPASKLVLPADLVVHYFAKSLDSVPRITHQFELYPDEIAERVRSKLWVEHDLGLPVQANDDSQAPHKFLEQHRRLDLDEDGYPEPYIVTIHEQTKKVLRIVARWDDGGIQADESGKIICIKPTQYFTKYGFVPSPDGGFYDVGFGMLLDPINESVNTVLNQLVDAGTLNNAGGGWLGGGVRMSAKKTYTSPGLWQPVEATGSALKENIVPYPVKEPSAVLFNLLGMLIEAGKTISAVKDIMSGDLPGNNTPATTVLAVIEQGMKVFNSIFKRIHRSLKSELAKIYDINRRYLPDESYFTVLDSPKAIAKADYKTGDFDIVPVTDPSVVTDMQRMARAQFLLQFAADPAMDGNEIKRRVLEAAQIEDIDALFAKGDPKPSPQQMEALAKLENENKKMQISALVAIAQIEEMRSRSVLNIANAEGVEAGTQLQQYQAFLDTMRVRLEGMAAGNSDGTAEQGTGSGVQGMAQPRSDKAISPIPGGLPPSLDGAVGGGRTSPGAMGMDPSLRGGAQGLGVG